MSHMYRYSWSSEEGVGPTWARVTGWLWAMWVLDTEPHPSVRKQQALLLLKHCLALFFKHRPSIKPLQTRAWLFLTWNTVPAIWEAYWKEFSLLIYFKTTPTPTLPLWTEHHTAQVDLELTIAWEWSCIYASLSAKPWVLAFQACESTLGWFTKYWGLNPRPLF